MPRSPAWSVSSALPIRLASRSGRLRRWRHRLVLAPALAGGWCWFGWSGAIPLALWWWHAGRRETVPEHWVIHPARLRAARLGRWRTCVHHDGAPLIEIFHDELAPVDLALLRRTLKAQLSARRRAEQVEAV